MTKKFVTILFLISGSICFGQTGLKELLDSVMMQAKATSLYTSTVNWDSLEKSIYSKAENPTNINDLQPAFEVLLNGLKDHHGKVLDAQSYQTIARFTDYNNLRHTDSRVYDHDIWKVVNDTALKFEYNILRQNIGYLKIVGIPANVDIEKESKKIRDAVASMAQHKVHLWIIDLRYNGGGNMHPMMAGIAPLVGDGVVGSLSDLKKNKIFDWEIKESNFIYGGYQAINFPNHLKFEQLPKIAVLTSRWTVSSGEIVATTLKGRPNTKFFGESTGGYTTNNGWDIINNQVILNISTGIFCDRNGITYENNIPVDIEIPFEVVINKEQDPCIVAAKKWLLEKVK